MLEFKFSHFATGVYAFCMQSGISLTLPAEALKSSGDDFARLQLLTFRSSSFFIPSDHVPDQKIVMKQWVVTAVVQGRKISNLSEPVEIIFRNIEVCLRMLQCNTLFQH